MVTSYALTYVSRKALKTTEISQISTTRKSKSVAKVGDSIQRYTAYVKDSVFRKDNLLLKS